MVEQVPANAQKMIRDVVRALGGIPEDYFCLDVETTGFKKSDDLIVAFGFCSVKGRKAKYYEFKVLDWATHPIVDPNWLSSKLNSCRFHMENNGRSFHGVTLEMMREVGGKPEDVLQEVLDLMLEAYEAGQTYVGHNLVSFDGPRIEFALQEWLGVEFQFDPARVFDTAAIEKASMVDMMPYKNESKFKYFRRVLAARKAGVNYKLDVHCVPKYQLDKKYDLDMEEAHKNPGFDAMLCHLLLEEFREIATRK